LILSGGILEALLLEAAMKNQAKAMAAPTARGDDLRSSRA
jgi:hypothetical protein